MLEINKKNARLWSMLGMRGSFGYAMTDIAETDDKLICMTADLCTTSGLDRFHQAFPERLINIGIAEQNMVGVAAGLAMDGYKVFANTFATFASMRSIEQLRTAVAYMNLNVKIVGLASGFAMGFFGNTHYAMEDISIARAIPNLIILSPADATETIKVMYAAAEVHKPVYIRLTGTVNCPMVYTEDYDFEIGKAVQLREGSDVTIIATGNMVYESMQAAKLLEGDGISSSVINMHTIKPLDTQAIDGALKSRLIVTVEEHSILGGLGGAVAEYLAKKGDTPKQLIIGVNDVFPKAGEYTYMLDKLGLTSQHIARKISEALKNS